MWWEHVLSVEGLNHEAFEASDGERGERGFTDEDQISIEDLGIQVRRH